MTEEKIQNAIIAADYFLDNKDHADNNPWVKVLRDAAMSYLKTLEDAEKSRWNRMNVTGWTNE